MVQNTHKDKRKRQVLHSLIYSQLNDFDYQKTIEFAAGASCLKHSIEFDFNLSSVDEVMNLINGDGSGRVQR